MGKKRHLTKLGRFREEKKPLAARSVILPPPQPSPGRMPFWDPIARFLITGPTEKLDMSGAELAANFGPSVRPDAIFFLDTGIFSTCTNKPLWDLFRSCQILITPMVRDELIPWIKNPVKNPEIRNLVYESIKSQFALGEDAEIADPSTEAARTLRCLPIQFRSPTPRYLEHGYEYYFKLLAVRKISGAAITQKLQCALGRPPTEDEFFRAAHPAFRERGFPLAKKGRDEIDSPNLLTDEQTVVIAVLTAILEGREVYIVTTDHDLPEQFHKLFLLIKEHYRAMLVAEMYASRPGSMAFRGVPVKAEPGQVSPWADSSILELRLPETEFDVLPRKFQSTVAHCIWLDPDETRPKFSYSCFTIEADTARVLRIKTATGGRSTDRFGDRNCTVRTTRLTDEQHEVVVSIGREIAIPVGNWGSFGADDFFNVITCCEEHTYIKPVEPARAGEVLSGTSDLPFGAPKSVEDYLIRYRKLLDQNRAYIRDQATLLTRLADWASWQRARTDGTLRELKSVCDSRDALLTRPETLALMGSVSKIADCLQGLALEPTQDDELQWRAWKSWSELTSQLGNSGPQNDEQVAAWQQASLAFLDASLAALDTKQRLVEEAVMKSSPDEEPPVSGRTPGKPITMP